MNVNWQNYQRISAEAQAAGTILVAVSKIKPVSAIRELYDAGHRDFGENYVQELVDKAAALPPDVRWHFIGHLQSNKVRYIAPFVHLIHGIDSLRLLKEVNKQGLRCNRVINVLLQVHIAQEETKFGFDVQDLTPDLFAETGALKNVHVKGFMGMASNTTDTELVHREFHQLKSLFEMRKNTGDNPMDTLSMGMSGDYKTAMEEGSTMIRIGSLLFGSR